MDLAMGAAGGSGGDDEPNNNYENLNIGRKSYRRRKSDQTVKLEEIFRECPHPDENQRRGIAEELGLEPKQVKFWFQNKRTQEKTLAERGNNISVCVENKKLQNENLIIKEALKNTICSFCEGPVNDDKGHEHSLEQLRIENARLKEECEKMSSLLARYMEKPMSRIGLESIPTRGSSARGPLLTSSQEKPTLELGLAPTPIRGSSSHGPLLGSSLNIGTRSTCMNLGGVTSLSFQDKDAHTIRKKMGKVMMSQVAIAAKEELMKLLCTNEPLWSKSSTDQKLSLNLECYENLFPKTNHFKNSKARVESSKGSRIVKIQARELVDMFLDSEKWASLFPTIMTKGHTIEVIENGSSENRSGALLLMYEEMHVLSPLVPSRESYFLRYCQQIHADIWVIADVSIDHMKGNNPHAHFWRFPSGCMIHHFSDGWCQVTWVEHVEVDEKIQTHQLYRDLVNNSIAYGAERWLTGLQRTCERFTTVGAEFTTSFDMGGGMTTLEERKNIIKLSQQMVKRFYGTLNILSKTKFSPHLTEENDDIRISVQKITSQSNAMITISAATSFWLPFHSQNLFDFFRDPMKRAKWDSTCYQSPVYEIAHISTGTHPSNYISVIQPIHPTSTNNAVIIQESSIDSLGSYIVYSSVKMLNLKKIIDGEDSSITSIFPSGIVFSGDVQSIANAQAPSSSGNGDIRTRGSLLTVAFQILMASHSTMHSESVSIVNSMIISTVKKMKDALTSDIN